MRFIAFVLLFLQLVALSDASSVESRLQHSANAIARNSMRTFSSGKSGSDKCDVSSDVILNDPTVKSINSTATGCIDTNDDYEPCSAPVDTVNLRTLTCSCISNLPNLPQLNASVTTLGGKVCQYRFDMVLDGTTRVNGANVALKVVSTIVPADIGILGKDCGVNEIKQSLNNQLVQATADLKKTLKKDRDAVMKSAVITISACGQSVTQQQKFNGAGMVTISWVALTAAMVFSFITKA